MVKSLAAEQGRGEISIEGEQGDGGVRAHPFETRNIHPNLPPKVRRLYDDGHWETAVFEAFKFVEKEVKRASGLRGKTGYALMMAAFNEDNALIKLNNLTTESEIDEQRGYKHMFAGSSAGIRNPRGHEVDLGDTPDEALDYLALASILLRKLDAADLR
ncbi:TIGR02391 family protein [Saccharomonospora sp. CUA-673]|nr:TIGR02391 family protein [Saccharomonospora sp. CUA-673]